MSKHLDEKLQNYIKNLAHPVSPYGGMVWDSSAKKLSDNLRARGIQTPKKLFWKYKLPNARSPQELMDSMLMEYYFVKYCSGLRVLADNSLTVREKMQILGYALSIKKSGLYKNVDKYADEIRRLNPELADIKTEDPIPLVEGAMFGFAPDEIKYFCKPGLRDFDMEHKLRDELKKFDVQTTYILAPETARRLISVLEKGK